MSSVNITPIKTAGMVAPVLRPLPSIFTYARVTADSRGRTAQALDEQFQANLRAMARLVERLGRQAEIPDSTWRPVIDRCVGLSGLTGAELASGIDGLCADLASLHKDHGKQLRKAVAADPDGFRDLYRKEAAAKKIMLFYTKDAAEQVESLERKLVDRCYYDCQAVADEWTGAPLNSADFVLFAPSSKPIQNNIMTFIDSYSLPFMILMGGDKTQDMDNMALLKSEYLYRKAGYNVLRSPFNPPRLYHAIESIHMRHLAGSVLDIPVVKTAAAAAEAAAGGQ